MLEHLKKTLKNFKSVYPTEVPSTLWSSLLAMCSHVKFTSLSLPQGPGREARPREGQKLRKREQEKWTRFQDISSLRLEGVLEMRCGGGWDIDVGSDTQVDPAYCLTSSEHLQRPPVTWFSIQRRARRKGTGLPSLISAELL